MTGHEYNKELIKPPFQDQNFKHGNLDNYAEERKNPWLKAITTNSPRVFKNN